MSDGFVHSGFDLGCDIGFVKHSAPNRGRSCDHARSAGHFGALLHRMLADSHSIAGFTRIHCA